MQNKKQTKPQQYEKTARKTQQTEYHITKTKGKTTGDVTESQKNLHRCVTAAYHRQLVYHAACET